ncbi:hypothetical protein OS493_019188 [Desmophyllum pertusum]|uniref:WSC domain-containing protein n=1 Tax=Desmophyllum pertusum TaxID=174260 RepID=A0A9W9YBL5_9CNID|nr:hypothetical protein OS493_019188 [Desmophyllum pertusum]
MEASVASLPSETEAVTSPEKQAKPVKRETYYHHSGDYSEPRVVYTREISDAREPIIERPAVFSQSNEDSEMDSSFGGDDDDDDEATLMIHEREIREDGYVGCYEDKSPDRDLPTILSVPSLTPDKCRSACQGAGHAYAGVQYGYLCRCGDSYGKYTKVSDEDCNARCVGDHAQKCGGFWRSAVFTTVLSLAIITTSTHIRFFTSRSNGTFKARELLHIESVQPMTEDMFDIPRSEIASAQAPELPEPAPEATTPESSGAYIQEIQHEIPLQESPVPSTPAETVKEDDSVAHASGEDMPGKVDASTPHAHESEPANNPEPAHTPEITSAPAISPQPPAAQDSIQSETKPSSDSSVVTNEQAPRVVHPQHDQAPRVPM